MVCCASSTSDGNLLHRDDKGQGSEKSSEGDLNWSFGGNEMEGVSAIRGSPSFDQSGNVLMELTTGRYISLSPDG